LPVKQHAYRVPETIEKFIKSEVKLLLQQGLIRKSHSPWSSPVMVVDKKTGDLRLVVDYRHLNKLTKKDVYPLPRIDDIFDAIREGKYFSTLDLASGYWQVEVAEEDKEKTAFVIPKGGLYEFNVMPFGLSNAPGTFQRLMDTTMEGLIWNILVVYLDDINIFRNTFEQHLERLQVTFNQLRQYNLKMKGSKCQFMTRKAYFLGHVISEEGIQPDSDKINRVQMFPIPKNIKELQSFLGLASYYRRFIKDFAEIAAPLHALLHKNIKFQWNDEADQAFNQLKECLTTAPIMAYPNSKKIFILYTDASTTGLGAVLAQNDDNGRERVIAYASRALNNAEKNYAITELEGLAVVWGTKKFRHYLYGRKFELVTDHNALVWLFNTSNSDVNSRIVRWRLKLQQYQFEIKYRKGKKHTNADVLSRMPMYYIKTNTDFDDIAYYLETINFPKGYDDKQKSKLQKIARNYIIEKGILYRQIGKNKPRRVVIGYENQEVILHSVHANNMGAHLGESAVYNKIKELYYWPKMHEMIKTYIKTCDICQRRGGRIHMEELNPIKTVSIRQQWGIDIKGPLQISENSNRYIVVAIEYFSKWVEARAIPDQKTKTVAKFFFEDVICRHGTPKILISDRGLTFRSELIAELNKKFNINHRLTTPYRPQTNGLVERFNRTIGESLAKMSQTKSDWDMYLPAMLFAYRTMKQNTTKFTPFMLMYGRQPVLPIELEIEPYDQNGNTPKDIQDLLIERTNKIVDFQNNVVPEAQTNIENAQKKMKKRHDETAQPSFKIGDKVLVHQTQLQANLSAKLEDKWIGPYYIHDVIGQGVYKLRNIEKQRLVKGTINGSRLKLYKERLFQPEILIDNSDKFFVNKMVLTNEELYDTIRFDLANLVIYPHPEVSKPYQFNDSDKEKIVKTYKAWQKTKRSDRIITLAYIYYLGELIENTSTSGKQLAKYLGRLRADTERTTAIRIYKIFKIMGMDQIYHTEKITVRMIVRLSQSLFDQIIAKEVEVQEYIDQEINKIRRELCYNINS
jgi:hypothetical protein